MITKKALSALVACMVLSSSGYAGGKLDVQGHRGARWVRPENTLSAFKYALDAGVDTLELDLHVTKDDVLVITHDPHLDGKLIHQMTLAEVKAVDIGSRPNARFPEQVKQPGERIPSFEEFLKWLSSEKNPRARKVALNVETKSEEAHPEYAPAPDKFSALVLKMLKKYRMTSRTTLQSFDFRTLVEARKVDPKITIAALIEDRPTESLVQIAQKLKAQVISPNHEWLTPADVESLHRAGVKVIPWTANFESEWKKLLDLKVDGIITDHPKALIEYLRK